MKHITQRKHHNLPGRRHLATFLGTRPTCRDILRRRVASIDSRVCVVVAALLGLVALFLPWVTLDSHGSSLSGAGLLAYSLQGGDRLLMWKVSHTATALLMVIPFGIAVGVCFTAINILRRAYRLDIPLLTCAGILVLLKFATPILDPRMHVFGGFTLPGAGLGILLVATLAVIVICSSSALRCRRMPAQP